MAIQIQKTPPTQGVTFTEYIDGAKTQSEVGPLDQLAVGRVVAALVGRDAVIPGSVRIITDWPAHVAVKTLEGLVDAAVRQEADQPRVARLARLEAAIMTARALLVGVLAAEDRPMTYERVFDARQTLTDAVFGEATKGS